MSQIDSHADSQQEQEQEQEQARRDLNEVLSRESGLRFFSRLLADLGAVSLMKTEDDMRMRNIVDQMIEQAAEAHPTAAARIVCGMYGIGAAKPITTSPATEENNG